jgi:hypothetical protein
LRGGTRSRRKPGRQTPAKATAPGARAQRVGVFWLPGTTEIPVAGLAHHSAAVLESVRGLRDGGQLDAVLIAEPDNPYDPHAVAVYMLAGTLATCRAMPRP